MRTALYYIGRPWEGPVWLLFVLLSVNRLFLLDEPGIKADWARGWQGLLYILAAALQVFIIAGGMAVCMKMMMKLFRYKRPQKPANMPELFNISLKAQSPYLAAAPLVLAIAAASHFLDPDKAQMLARATQGILALSMLAVLFFTLRTRFPEFSDGGALALILSPYLISAFLVLATMIIFLTGIALMIAYFAFR